MKRSLKAIKCLINITTYTHSKKEHNLDVIGLWENRLEPFDLQRALAGESVMLRNGSIVN